MDINKFSKSSQKGEIQEAFFTLLSNQEFRITEIDFNRPWGGFFRIAEEQSEKFIQIYFAGSDIQFVQGLKMTPKILILAPGTRLSWQYHHRRSEIWRVISGPIAVITSSSDEQSAPRIYQTNQIIKLHQGQRHRGIGLENWGAVAEIWQHTDPEHPSDESDIVRVQDDFSRS